MGGRGRVSALLGVAIPLLTAFPVIAGAQSFYKDKTIRIVVGADAGGSYDISARFIARFLGRFIPGAPGIVVQNMPGAGSVNAANFIYNVAPQDGLVMGAFVQTLPLSQLFGDAEIRFDANKLRWIGNPTSSPNVIVVWRDSQIRSMRDARNQRILMGVTSRASSGGMEIALSNNVLGTHFEAVAGYKGGNEIDLAMERREVLGRAGQSWEGWKQTRANWIRDAKLTVLAQIGPRRARDLPDAPLISDLAETPTARDILDIYSGAIGFGRPLAVGPGVPDEQVRILRDAFRAMMADPEVIRESAAAGYEIDPVQGGELQSLVAHLVSSPRDVVEATRHALELKQP